MAHGMHVQRCVSMGCQVGMRWPGMILSCACTSTCADRHTCLHTNTHRSSMWHSGFTISPSSDPKHCLWREETIDGCKFQAQSKSVWFGQCCGCCMHFWTFMRLRLFSRRGLFGKLVRPCSCLLYTLHQNGRADLRETIRLFSMGCSHASSSGIWKTISQAAIQSGHVHASSCSESSVMEMAAVTTLQPRTTSFASCSDDSTSTLARNSSHVCCTASFAS